MEAFKAYRITQQDKGVKAEFVQCRLEPLLEGFASQRPTPNRTISS